ncbi:MAG: hypothetical protein ACI9WU_004699 [Myxococcota bacterium]|jgi:hypothetical protein
MTNRAIFWLALALASPTAAAKTPVPATVLEARVPLAAGPFAQLSGVPAGLIPTARGVPLGCRRLPDTLLVAWPDATDRPDPAPLPTT